MKISRIGARGYIIVNESISEFCTDSITFTTSGYCGKSQSGYCRNIGAIFVSQTTRVVFPLAIQETAFRIRWMLTEWRQRRRRRRRKRRWRRQRGEEWVNFTTEMIQLRKSNKSSAVSAFPLSPLTYCFNHFIPLEPFRCFIVELLTFQLTVSKFNNWFEQIYFNEINWQLSPAKSNKECLIGDLFQHTRARRRKEKGKIQLETDQLAITTSEGSQNSINNWT